MLLLLLLLLFLLFFNINVSGIIDSRLPQWFTVDVDVDSGFLGPMDVSRVSDVSEVHGAYIFRIESISNLESLCVFISH